MNPAHLHLLVTHFPIVGTALLLPLLGWAWLQRDEPALARVAAVLMLVSALTAGVALLSGEPAEELMETYPGIQKQLIETHEDRAKIAIYGAALLGLLGLTLGASSRKATPTSGPLLLASLGVALVTAGLMAWTGAAGGAIRHPEIDQGAQPARVSVEAPTSNHGQRDDDD